MLLILIAWNMIKLDQFSESFGEEIVQKNFEQLALVYKINFLNNKLFELQKMNLCPCDIMVKSLHNRLIKLQEIKEKLVLQNYDEQCKCEEALMWLERPEKNRRYLIRIKVVYNYVYDFFWHGTKYNMLRCKVGF